MISVQVEKEIKQENHIFGSFTFRQAIVIGIAAAVLIVFYAITRADLTVLAPLGMALGVVAYFFGFKKRDGLYYEYFLMKSLKSFIFMNTQRKYRTKNKYITMLNKAYTSEKMEDMRDKKKRKYIERDAKSRQSKKTSMRAYL